ncbi:Ig-like domain-containing protein [Candidatus Roizmanbacteria bacterium]|nr:Ig-like domain-containing protein [Candidatus Roizmanbacteria bacterium]
MKKIHLIAGGISILLILILIVITIIQQTQQHKSTSQQEGPSATPIIIPTALLSPTTDLNPLKVLSSVPQDNAINVPNNFTAITMTFNKLFNLSDFSIKIIPSIKYSASDSDKKLTLKLIEPLKSSTQYIVRINFKSPHSIPYIFSFTTIGPTPTLVPDTSSQEAAQEEDQFQLKYHPDVYVSNQVPYETNDFKITTEFKSSPRGHFAFTVLLKNTDMEKSKVALFTWLKSLGLQDIDIKSLDIIYQ